MKFFSVIIPTYNRAHIIGRAIKSVQEQSYKNFELIIVDDGSTDNTQEVLADFENIKVIKTENKGVSSARNTGVLAAKYEWICFLDSDDEWLLDKLQLQAEFIENNPEAKIIHGEEIWIRNGKRVNQMKKYAKGGGDQFDSSLKLCAIGPSTVCLHISSLIEFDGFDESMIVCEDYDLWLKITHKYEVGFIDKPLIKKYGGHEDQLSLKYHSMDYFRIKSMFNLANNYELSSKQINRLKEEVSSKAKILIKGYEKHKNLKNYNEVSKILEWSL